VFRPDFGGRFRYLVVPAVAVTPAAGEWHHESMSGEAWWAIGVAIVASFVCAFVATRVVGRRRPLSRRMKDACVRTSSFGGAGAGSLIIDLRTGVLLIGIWLVVVAILWLIAYVWTPSPQGSSAVDAEAEAPPSG
jgi:hypothetical protein